MTELPYLIWKNGVSLQPAHPSPGLAKLKVPRLSLKKECPRQIHAGDPGHEFRVRRHHSLKSSGNWFVFVILIIMALLIAVAAITILFPETMIPTKSGKLAKSIKLSTIEQIVVNF